MNPDVIQQIMACRELPSLPAVAAKVIELTQNPEVALGDLGAAIAMDQGLSARLLRTVNSSFFGQRGRCSSIRQAMVVLGLSAVKTLALGFSLVSAVSEMDGGGLDFVAYWRRA